MSMDVIMDMHQPRLLLLMARVHGCNILRIPLATNKLLPPSNAYIAPAYHCNLRGHYLMIGKLCRFFELSNGT